MLAPLTGPRPTGGTMGDVFLYADETGNLDYGGAGKRGATTYFGFGTAVFYGDHGRQLMEGLRLRVQVTAAGVSLTRGFHAVDDSRQTRDAMYTLIGNQAPRFDTTFLLKSAAYPSVQAAGEMRLYKMAWFLHFKEIARQIASKGDRLIVVAGTFGTHKRRAQAEAALADVCSQIDRDITLCVWDAASSWGLQVADYALWAVHRDLEGRVCDWYEPHVKPHLESVFTPWGREAVTPPLPTE